MIPFSFLVQRVATSSFYRNLFALTLQAKRGGDQTKEIACFESNKKDIWKRITKPLILLLAISTFIWSLLIFRHSTDFTLSVV